MKALNDCTLAQKPNIAHNKWIKTFQYVSVLKWLRQSIKGLINSCQSPDKAHNSNQISIIVGTYIVCPNCYSYNMEAIMNRFKLRLLSKVKNTLLRNIPLELLEILAYFPLSLMHNCEHYSIVNASNTLNFEKGHK